MAFPWDAFPYTNFHELNLDYILRVAAYAKSTSDAMIAWRKEHQEEYKELLAHVNALQKWVDNVESGNIPAALINSLGEWIDKNLESLIGHAIKFVWFGLTSDGYFVAYIPDSWSELTFDSVMDFTNEYYGHLLICYDDKKLAETETYYGSPLNNNSSLYWSRSELQPYQG